MRRRRFLITAVALGAIAIIGLGMALTASARQDVLSKVHSVTARFNSIEQAKKAGYEAFYVCTEQPGKGTMGQHYVNFKLVGDPAIDPLQPEALVYEPQANGGYKLVALEWVRVGPEPTRIRRCWVRPCSTCPRATATGSSPMASTSGTTGCTSPTRAGDFADWNPERVLPRQRGQRRLNQPE